MKKQFGFLLLAFSLIAASAMAGTSDSDRLSTDLIGATLVFKQAVTVPAGPRYQSTKILWNAGPNAVRAWVIPETETGLTLLAGTQAKITNVYADGWSLMGANVKAKTTNGDEISVMLQYASVDNVTTGLADIPTVGDLKLAFDLVLP